jgi:hypothetical protein
VSRRGHGGDEAHGAHGFSESPENFFRGASLAAARSWGDEREKNLVHSLAANSEIWYTNE